MPDVVTIGPLNADLLLMGMAPTDLTTLTQWVGPSRVVLTAAGSVGYVTQALVKLGLSAGIVSVLAEDALGDMILTTLKGQGVEVQHVQREAGTLSGLAIYLLLFGSKKGPMTYRMPTHLPWPATFSKEDLSYILSARHVHCGGYLHFPTMWTSQLADLFQMAHTRGLTTSLDPQKVLFPIDRSLFDVLAGVLKVTDVLLLDEEEACQITQTRDVMSALRILRQAGPAIVALKRGAHGALVSVQGRVFEQPAVFVPEDQIVETVGAGDTFDAGLLTGYLAGWSIEQSARFATLAAASTLRGAGGTSSLATREALEAMLNFSGRT